MEKNQDFKENEVSNCFWENRNSLRWERDLHFVYILLKLLALFFFTMLMKYIFFNQKILKYKKMSSFHNNLQTEESIH